MSILISVLALIVTLGILVSVHEYGHYWVARRCGVKVLKFSVGFGKVLFSRTDKHGTEFAVAAIPLGGYVKMLDEREAPVAEELLGQAFNRKTVWQRMAVVLAGPIANIIFAILAYMLLFMTGVTSVKPVIGNIIEGSPAFVAGMVGDGQAITAIDGNPVTGWQEVNYQLINRLGDTGNIVIELDDKSVYELAIDRWLSDQEEPDTVKSLGVEPYRPLVAAVLDELKTGLPAEQAGLKTNDQILTVDGTDISDWFDFVTAVKQSPNKPLALTVLRDGQVLSITLIPAQKTADNGEIYGFAGAMVKAPELPKDFIMVAHYGPIDAFVMGAQKTWDMSIMTLESIGKMIQGLLSVKNLSGPITIAKVANQSVMAGFETFIGFLAYISIMLAVMNLLPIPVLDGGHFLFYAIEAVKGSPVSEKVQMMGMKLGMTMLMLLMFTAIFNDIARF